MPSTAFTQAVLRCKSAPVPQLAQKLGIPKTSMLRARAGISYALLQAVENGDCGLPEEDLLTLAERLLEIGRDTLAEALRLEVAEESVVYESIDGRPCVFLPYLRRAEEAIAAAIRGLQVGRPPWPAIDTDAHRARRADTVALQEHHDLANGLLLAPAGCDAAKTGLADAVDLEQAMRSALDHVEDGLAERGDQLAGEVRADALDHARPEIGADALDCGRGHHLQEGCPELEPVITVLLPMAARLNGLAGVHVGGGAEHGYEVAVTTHLDAEDAKSGLGAVEGDAFNEPGQRLPTSLRVWCGIDHRAVLDDSAEIHAALRRSERTRIARSLPASSSSR